MPAARSCSPACIRRAARSRAAAAASTSPTSCSACRSRRPCSTVLATCGCPARSLSAYVQDDWRRSDTLTFNLGVRYELICAVLRAERTDGQPRRRTRLHRGGAGALRRDRPVPPARFPKALVDTDTNNVAPRVGFAWRVRPGTILRGGYGISYNAGSYSSIARQLVGAAAVRHHEQRASARRLQPLDLSDPFAAASPGDTTNTYGVDPDYALGLVQTWNADLSRDIRQVWNVGAGYTETRGSSLDIVRAPNRGPIGLRIPGVQPFLWQTSEGSSVLHAGHVPASAPAGERAWRRRHLHAREVARQRVVDRRRRDDRRAERSGPWRRVGALELRSAASARRRTSTSSCRSAPTGAGSHNRPAGGALRRLALHGNVRAAVGHAAHAARGRRRRPTSHAAPTARCAPTTTATRMQLGESDDRPVLQHERRSPCRRPARSATPAAT